MTTLTCDRRRILPLSEAVRGISRSRYNIAPKHDLNLYADLLEENPVADRRVFSNLLGRGTDSLVFELPDNQGVVKVTWRKLPDEVGKRPFDLPVLDRTVLQVRGKQTTVTVFTQPKVEIGASQEELIEFCNLVSRAGFRITDNIRDRPEQVGRHNGEIRLVDLFAVR